MTNTNNLFNELGIEANLLDIIRKLKFTVPTPIQAKAIPTAVEGNDVIGVAQTGTGKTLAFGIPMVQRLVQTGGNGLIVVPTRELALQVEETMAKLAPAFNLTTVVLIGGVGMQPQVESLKHNPDIIIATPGRLIDHMDRGAASLDNVRFLVLDEADRMLDLGFSIEISVILRSLPKDRQTLLFSATMPSDIVKIASTHMKLPVTIEIAPPGTAAELVSQEMFVVKEDMKSVILADLLNQYPGSVLIFTRTKKGAQRVTRSIKKSGFSAGEIHSDRSMNERKEALAGFKSGKYRILVATDIAARGIDVTGIELVINYDLPDEPGNYVHRIGRTGRAGMTGHAISLATPEQAAEVKNIEKIIKTIIPVSKHDKVENEEFSAIPFSSPLVNPTMINREIIDTYVPDHSGDRGKRREREERKDKWK
jgi:ATP-dependent RNA helicase RhlE